MKKRILLNLLFVTLSLTLSNGSGAVDLDLSQATIKYKSQTILILDNVSFGDLGAPVWAEFHWDSVEGK